MGNSAVSDIRIREIYVNLKNYSFDVLGGYKMDEKEAQKFIEWFEEMEAAEDASTSGSI